jgi:hypothetical protein
MGEFRDVVYTKEPCRVGHQVKPVLPFVGVHGRVNESL